MSLKREYIVLIVIIAVLSVYLVMNKSGQINYELPEIDKVSENDISKIEIASAEDKVLLTRKDNKWFFGEKEYLADLSKVNNMIDALSEMSLTELVSESKNYTLYELDGKNRITAKVWYGENLVRNIEIGKAAPTYRHTFVRLQGDDNVYQAKGNFRRDFEQSADDLRDKVVLEVDADDVKKLSVSSADLEAEYHLEEKEVKKEDLKDDTEVKAASAVWKDKANMIAGNSKINTLIGAVRKLECDKFLEDKEKSDFKDPLFSLNFEGEKSYSLRIYKKLAGGDTVYPAVSSASKYVFALPEYEVDSLKEKIGALRGEDK